MLLRVSKPWQRLSPQADYIHYQLQAAYRKGNRPADADEEL